MLNGAMLALPLHVVTGRHPGPTLGIITNTHGDEFLPTIAIRELLAALDTASSRAGSRSSRSPTRSRPPASGG